MNKIEMVWGTCDGYGILFTQVSNDTWICDVPADLSDGMYIVEIYARTFGGVTIYTTAILHMFDSKCVSFKFMNDGVYVAIKTININIELVKEDVEVRLSTYNIKLLDDMIKVVIICD